MVCDPLTGLYPCGLGELSLAARDQVAFRLGWVHRLLQRRGNRAVPRGAFASERAGSGPLLTARQGRPQTEETPKASGAGDQGSCPAPAHESALCLCQSFSLLFAAVSFSVNQGW